MLVAARDACARHRPSGAVAARAVAGDGPDAFRFAGARDGLLPGNPFCFFILRNALDGFPSCAAAKRAIGLRHDASIGARSRMRKRSRAVETGGRVEKHVNRDP